jgi:hypothetical protein
MPDIDPRLIIVFLWIFGCLFVDFRLLLRPPVHLPRWPYALLAALLVRLIPALILPRGAAYEVSMFDQAGQGLLEGQNIYFMPIAHPYLPFQLYWMAAARLLVDGVGISFTFWLKLPNILADAAIAVLIYQAVRQNRDGAVALRSSWLYALNPIVILVTAYQGQFDAIPLFLMLSAWYVVEFHAGHKQGLAFSAVLLGFGILSKTWPAVFLPIVLLRLPSWKSKLSYLALSVTVPVAGVLLYEAIFPDSWYTVLRRAMRAGPIPGWWGYSSVLNVVVELTGRGKDIYESAVAVGRLAALGGGLTTIWFTRRRPMLYALLLTVLVLFTVIPNLGLQNLSWLIPLALLTQMLDELFWYTIGAGFLMVIGYWGVNLTPGLYLLMPRLPANIIIQLSSLTAWGVIALWCGQMLLGRRLLPRVVNRDERGTLASLQPNP